MQLLKQTLAAALAAQTSPVFQIEPSDNRDLLLEAVFAYGSGGTSIEAWVQTSLDGTNWTDIADFKFTTSAARALYNLSSATPVTTAYTPTDGSLAANTVKDGIMGTYLRVKWTSVGIYAGASSLIINAAGPRIRG